MTASDQSGSIYIPLLVKRIIWRAVLVIIVSAVIAEGMMLPPWLPYDLCIAASLQYAHHYWNEFHQHPQRHTRYVVQREFMFFFYLTLVLVMILFLTFAIEYAVDTGMIAH